MNKLMMVATAAMVGAMVTGCATTQNGDDAIANWKADRTPVKLLKSSISVTTSSAAINTSIKTVATGAEALDVVPYELYKATTVLVDKLGYDNQTRADAKAYAAYYADAVKQGKSSEEASKIAADRLKSEQGDDVMKRVGEYVDSTKGADYVALTAEISELTQKLTAAQLVFKDKSQALIAMGADIVSKHGSELGFGAMKLPGQIKDDIAFVGGQLKDTGVGLKLAGEIVVVDKWIQANMNDGNMVLPKEG